MTNSNVHPYPSSQQNTAIRNQDDCINDLNQEAKTQPSKKISEDRMMRALYYLATTDEEFARAKAYLDALSEQRKTIKAFAYLEAKGSQGDRTEQAYNSEEYRALLKKLELATLEYERIKNKRKTEELIVDVWRSILSARKAGVVV